MRIIASNMAFWNWDSIYSEYSALKSYIMELVDFQEIESITIMLALMYLCILLGLWCVWRVQISWNWRYLLNERKEIGIKS